MKILKLPEVIKLTALSRSSIYAFVKAGSFPAPVALGKKAVGWVESEVVEFLIKKIDERKKPDASNGL